MTNIRIIIPIAYCVLFTLLVSCAGAPFFPKGINDLQQNEYLYKTSTYQQNIQELNDKINKYNMKCGLLPNIVAIGETYRFNKMPDDTYILSAHNGGDVYLVARAVEDAGKCTVRVWSTSWRTAQYLLNILDGGQCVDSIWSKTLHNEKSR